jgi:hypothetical protein
MSREIVLGKSSVAPNNAFWAGRSGAFPCGDDVSAPSW